MRRRIVTPLPDDITVTASETSREARPEQPPAQRSAAEAFIRHVRTRQKVSAEAEAKMRDDMLEDQKFAAGEMWPAHIEAARAADGRPCLKINRTRPFIRQITNQQREARPGIEIEAVETGDEDVASVLQGMVRNVETTSDADVAYETAGDHQTTMGRGYWRVVPEYADSESGPEQCLKIKRVPNPFCVYFDPAAQEFDYSDARYAIIIEDLPVDEYKVRYKDSALAGLDDFTSIGDAPPDWISEDKIRVAEYFYVETEVSRMALWFEAGPVGPPQRRVTPLDKVPEGMQALKQWPLEKRRVLWAKINAVEILEGNAEKTAGKPVPFKHIPVVALLGDEFIIDGRRDYRGIVRDSKDPARMNNYWKSAITEAIALAPRAPWIVVEGQLEGYEHFWKQANVRNFPYLTYKAKSIGGELAPAPQRQVLEPPIQAMTLAAQIAENDLRATTGFAYEVGSDEPRRELSGKAIIARQKEGQLGNSHFMGNLARALRYTGRLCLEAFPILYDVPRIERITGEDRKKRTVMVHTGRADLAPADGALPRGVERVFDLSIGRYDVVISVGPSYQTKRQEAREMLVELTKNVPAIGTVGADLLVQNMDFDGHIELAKRLKKALPPQFQDDPATEDIPPAVIAKMKAYEQLIDALQAELDEKSEEIRTKKIELASKEFIAGLQEQTKQAVALAKIEMDEGIALLKAEYARIETLLNLSHERLLAQNQAIHESGMAAADRAAATPAPAVPAEG